MYIVRIQTDFFSEALQRNLESKYWFNKRAYAAGTNEKQHTWVEFKIRLKDIPRLLTKMSNVISNVWISNLRKDVKRAGVVFNGSI